MYPRALGNNRANSRPLNPLFSFIYFPYRPGPLPPPPPFHTRLVPCVAIHSLTSSRNRSVFLIFALSSLVSAMTGVPPRPPAESHHRRRAGTTRRRARPRPVQSAIRELRRGVRARERCGRSGQRWRMEERPQTLSGRRSRGGGVASRGSGQGVLVSTRSFGHKACPIKPTAAEIGSLSFSFSGTALAARPRRSRLGASSPSPPPASDSPPHPAWSPGGCHQASTIQRTHTRYPCPTPLAHNGLSRCQHSQDRQIARS